MLFDAGQESGVDDGEPVTLEVRVPVPIVLEVCVEETNLAPWIPVFDSATPRVDFR